MISDKTRAGYDYEIGLLKRRLTTCKNDEFPEVRAELNNVLFRSMWCQSCGSYNHQCACTTSAGGEV